MKIVSWNIAGGRKINTLKHFDYGEEDLGYFADKLNSVGADVVCLQETHTDSTRSVAKELAKMLKMDYVFDSPASISHIDKNSFLGNSILSKFHIDNPRTTIYPYPDFELVWKDGRVADRHDKLLQIVKTNGTYIANTQLLPIGLFGYTYNDQNVEIYAREIEKALIGIPSPAIFCGDFSGDFANDLVEDVFKNLFTENKFADAIRQITRPLKDRPGRQTDHIYFSPQFTLIGSGVIQTQTDHFLCWADFKE